MKYPTLLLMALLVMSAGAVTIKMPQSYYILALSDETRGILCSQSGGVWHQGYGCTCQPDWVWQDSFGCKPFGGTDPQQLCMATNGQWNVDQKLGVASCICPGAAELGNRFNAATGCPAYTPKQKGLLDYINLGDAAKSFNDFTAAFTKDVMKDPIKYFVYMIYIAAALIGYKLLSGILGFGKKEEVIVKQQNA
jgi:hypothetical protein